MKKNIFEEEFMRRSQIDDNTYGMIGTELKRIRTRQSQTLSAIAENLCSVSYLCKIEKAQLKPNRQMLMEICKKLKLEIPNLEILFSLKNKIFKCVELYFYNKSKEINNLYNEVKSFDNYRTQLISFIKFLSDYDLDNAMLYTKSLFKIANTMQAEELEVFLVFYSILCYYLENYKEALDNLALLKNNKNNYLNYIAKICKLECLVKINSVEVLVFTEAILDEALIDSKLFLLDYIKYIKGIYFIHNELYLKAIEIMEALNVVEYKKSLEFLIDYNLNQLKKDYDLANLRPFCKLLYTYIYNPKEYLNLFLQISFKDRLTIDFNNNIASYLSLAEEEKYEELNEIIIPNICQTKNSYEKQFFLKEFSKICQKMHRYKSFVEAYILLNERK